MEYIASILELGPIGLSLLLAVLVYRFAVLAYRLLPPKPGGEVQERPIYLFMAFCLALLGVSAALQYSESKLILTAQTELENAKKRK
jgi:hypothetical protein